MIATENGKRDLEDDLDTGEGDGKRTEASCLLQIALQNGYCATYFRFALHDPFSTLLCILGRLILKRTVYSLLWLHGEFGQGEKLAGNLESVLVPPLLQGHILSRQVIRGHSSAPLTLFYNSGSFLALVATPSYLYFRLAVASPPNLADLP